MAGILAEARGGWAVLGIGVNVAGDASDLPEHAGTLGRDDVEATLAELLEALERRLSEDRDSALAALRERDALLGQPVRWQDGEGTGAGIDDTGALLVTLADGRPKRCRRRGGSDDGIVVDSVTSASSSSCPCAAARSR